MGLIGTVVLGMNEKPHPQGVWVSWVAEYVYHLPTETRRVFGRVWEDISVLGFTPNVEKHLSTLNSNHLVIGDSRPIGRDASMWADVARQGLSDVQELGPYLKGFVHELPRAHDGHVTSRRWAEVLQHRPDRERVAFWTHADGSGLVVLPINVLQVDLGSLGGNQAIPRHSKLRFNGGSLSFHRLPLTLARSGQNPRENGNRDSSRKHPPIGKRLIETIACVLLWAWLSRYDNRLDLRGRVLSAIGLWALGIGLSLWCLTLLPFTWGWWL